MRRKTYYDSHGVPQFHFDIFVDRNAICKKLTGYEDSGLDPDGVAAMKR